MANGSKETAGVVAGVESQKQGQSRRLRRGVSQQREGSSEETRARCGSGASCQVGCEGQGCAGRGEAQVSEPELWREERLSAIESRRCRDSDVMALVAEIRRMRQHHRMLAQVIRSAVATEAESWRSEVETLEGELEAAKSAIAPPVTSKRRSPRGCVQGVAGLFDDGRAAARAK